MEDVKKKLDEAYDLVTKKKDYDKAFQDYSKRGQHYPLPLASNNQKSCDFYQKTAL